MTTTVEDFFHELDGGVFAERLSAAISDVAAAVIDNSKPGDITIKLSMKRIGSSHQVAIDHKLIFNRPTAKGKVSEENTTQTPMHVGSRGKVTLFPENQGQLFGKKGEPVSSSKE